MKYAIAGVAPPQSREVTIMTVWPSIASTAAGRFIGRMCLMGGGGAFTIGNLFALALIPVALGLYFAQLFPLTIRRYRLTNRRLVVQKGIVPVDERDVPLDGFDTIEVRVLPGQAWFPAGELVFQNGPVEVFRLSGVRHPQGFRHACLKARNGYVGVQRSMRPATA